MTMDIAVLEMAGESSLFWKSVLQRPFLIVVSVQTGNKTSPIAKIFIASLFIVQNS